MAENKGYVCTSDIDWFSTPPQIHERIKAVYKERVNPSLGYGKVEHSSLNFIISSDSSRYTDINNIRLRTKWEIRNINYMQKIPAVPAGDLGEEAIAERTVEQVLDIAAIDLFSVTAFKNVLCKINGVIVSGMEGNYYLSRYVLHRLKYGRNDPNRLKYWLEGYAPDDAGKADVVSVDGVDPVADSQFYNSGFAQRQQLTGTGKTFDLSTVLLLDISQSGRLLPTGCEIQLQLIHNADSLRLMTNQDKFSSTIGPNSPPPAAVLLDAYLEVQRISLIRDIAIEAERTATITPYLMPHRRTCCYGPIQRNPLVFEHHQLQSIQVHIGTDDYPDKPLEADFRDELGVSGFLDVFEHMTQVLGRYNSGEFKNALSLVEYAEGFTLFIISTEPNIVSHAVHAVKPNNQAISVSLKFANPLSTTSAVNLFYLPISPSFAAIDSARNLYLDYASGSPSD